MYTVSRTGGYGPKKYIVDLESDISSLPTHGIPPGSIAFVIEKSIHYMLNNQRRWVKVELSTGGNGGGSGGGETPDEVIYDGGLLESNSSVSRVIYDGGILG